MIILAAALLLACHSPTAPPSGVAVEAVLSASVVSVGEPLTIEVHVTNTSSSEYSVPGSAGQCISILDVRDARGRSVLYGDPRMCDLAAVAHRLAPFGALTDRLPLTGLAAGHYRVRASVAVIGYGQLWSPFVSLSVRSP